MIPDHLYDKKLLATLGQMLRTELSDVRAARRELDRHWIDVLKAYSPLPDVKVKDFPFKGAANLNVPLVATDTDKVYAWMMALLFGQDNLWAMKPIRPDMVPLAPRIQEFMTWAQTNEL